jgi:superfamily II DNA/RNA helicase
MPKVARQSVLARFRSGKLRALVVSDVVARGLDVADCDAGGCALMLVAASLVDT